MHETSKKNGELAIFSHHRKSKYLCLANCVLLHCKYILGILPDLSGNELTCV